MTETRIDVAEVKEKLADVIERARNGEEFSITRDGVVIAILSPAEDPDRRHALGMFRGRIWMSPDFNDPLTDEELREWGL
jgi:antitoxin (DNA-binding transcriptional repressor) of toxin-antitoxin stability system